MHGLNDKTVEAVHHIFGLFPEIEEVVLYGSRAMGTYREGSDIDLVLKGASLNLALLHKLAATLDDLLLPYTFDIAVIDHISNDELKAHIDRVGVVFYRKSVLELLHL